MDVSLITGISAVPVIIALVQMAKLLGLQNRFCPLLSLALGIIFSFVYSYYGEQLWLNALVGGIALGLSAIGVYSAIKNTLRVTQRTRKEQRKKETDSRI